MKHSLDLDLSDDEFVKAYFSYLRGFTEEELRDLVTVFSPETHQRMYQIALKSQKAFHDS